LALAAVKACQVSAGERGPEHAVTIDVAAARTVAGDWRLTNFRQCCVCRIGPGIAPDHRARISQRRAPHRTVERAHRHGVEAERDPRVLARVDRLTGLDIVVALAIAVGVENERRPALRLLLVAGLLERFSIEPADGAC